MITIKALRILQLLRLLLGILPVALAGSSNDGLLGDYSAPKQQQRRRVMEDETTIGNAPTDSPTPDPTGPLTYVPGDTTVSENGLLLSKGLTARRVATMNQKVQYASGGQSEREFHTMPDGAGIFADPTTGGWIYVSNSENENQNGGVGALTFNSNGEVVDYQMLLENTTMNCGGGKTWYGTWISCEEITPGGQIYEVDPWGVQAPKQTLMGGERGSAHESAAYDNRDPQNPKFYITTDMPKGPLVRYTPDAEAVKYALENDDYTNLLHSNDSGTAKIDYLILEPSDASNIMGTFSWTNQRVLGKENAGKYFPECEGIDVRNGMVYFTCKANKHLFILNIDARTYERSSTESGSFDGKPDQVARILGENHQDDILYFCEDNGRRDLNGVHGRDSTGRYYTILESDGTQFKGETTGLAFSPNNMFMYVSFQVPGIIFEISRTDGYPFGGQKLDILYHANS